MNMIRKLLVLLLVAAVASPLVGCGRKATPKAPPGSEYPRDYPTQ